MVVFWIVLGATALLIFITAIEKGHHQITKKEESAITITTIKDLKEQDQRVNTKHSSIMNAERLK